MSANKYLQQATGAFQQVSYSDLATTPSTLFVLQNFSNIISSNTTTSSTATYVKMVSVSQGSSGTWMVNAWATWSSSLLTGLGILQLTDGSTQGQVFASAFIEELTAAAPMTTSLAGIVTLPTSNISLLCLNATAGGNITCFRSGSATFPSSRDTGITAVRIG